MISLLAAKATLHIIGLATVMHGDPGIDVVMPHVNPDQTHVEEHTPVLIVRNEELVRPTGDWTTRPYGDRFTLVELTGDDIQFLPDAPNPVAKVPVGLPHLTNGCRSIVAVPRPVVVGVRGKEGAGAGHPAVEVPPPPSLIATYRPPLYTAAAAVLRVPYGSANACSTPANRIDTRVGWATAGGVTIVGKRHKSRLRIEGDDILVVAGNVPTWVLTPGEKHAEDAHASEKGHFSIYYTMLETLGRNGCLRDVPSDVPPCEATIRRVPQGPAGGPPVTGSVPEIVFYITSECSDTQYP